LTWKPEDSNSLVIPAKAGIQGVRHWLFRDSWTPAFAGVTTSENADFRGSQGYGVYQISVIVTDVIMTMARELAAAE
jgi:hypothetical protein